MGKYFPPYYGVEDAVQIINKISELDLQINELMIQREAYVTTLTEKLKEKDTTEAQA